MIQWLHDWIQVLFYTGNLYLFSGVVIVCFGTGLIVKGQALSEDYGKVVFRVTTAKDGKDSNYRISTQGVPFQKSNPTMPLRKVDAVAFRVYKKILDDLDKNRIDDEGA